MKPGTFAWVPVTVVILSVAGFAGSASRQAQPSCADDPAPWVRKEHTHLMIDQAKARAVLGTPAGYGGNFWNVMYGIGVEGRHSIYFKRPRFAGWALAALAWWDFGGHAGFNPNLSHYNVLRGDYDYAQLYACKMVLGERWQLLHLGDSITMWGVDDARNRVLIGVAGDSTIREVVRLDIARIGIPVDIVVVETTGRTVLQSDQPR